MPGGVTLPARDAEDAGQVQSLGARFSHDLISLDYAATMGCRACGSSGGGCQFLGTAATSQVVAEGLGLALPHSALAPSGEPVWLELASRSATALHRLHLLGVSIGQIPHERGRRERDAPPCRLWRLDESSAARSGDRCRRRAEAARRRGLDPDQSRDTAPGGRAAQWTTRFRDRAGVHGWRRSGSDAASPPHGAVERPCAHRDWRHARRHPRLVGIERAPPGGTRTTRVRIGHRSGSGHHDARLGTPRRAHQHDDVPARQPRPAGVGHQGHRHRCFGD